MRKVLNRLEEIVMAFLLAFMTVLTFVQVFLRYVFNSGWVWSLEATTYSFAAFVLVGMSYGVRTQTHIAVDLVVRRLRPSIRNYVAIFASFCCLSYALLMVYGSSLLVERLFVLGNYARDVPVPKWLLTVIMPLGFALLTFRFLEAGWRILRRRDEGASLGVKDPSVTLIDQRDSESSGGK